nr:uncharacterized protein LOC129263551 [Lytechinus pictus]
MTKQPSSEIDVRLAGGPSPDKGTVQIMQNNGTWETTCGINLDINDVIVICKQLGYTGANRAIFSTPYGQDPTPPTIGLFCNGNSLSTPNTYTPIKTTILRIYILKSFFPIFPGEDDLAGCQLFQQQSCSITGAASCHGVNYLGCYVDKPGDRVFTGDSLLAEPLMTISYCIQYCNAITVINSSDYAYAGFNNGNECFCGGASDNYTRHGVASDRECQSPCQGDPTESCGGQGYIAVFRIDTETRETTPTIGFILSTEKVLEMSTEMTVITDQPTSEMSINPNNDLTSSPTATTLSSILLQTGSHSSDISSLEDELRSCCTQTQWLQYNDEIESDLSKHRSLLTERRNKKIGNLTKKRQRSNRFRRHTNNNDVSPHLVVNLSSSPLYQAETSLLSKGLKFCPTPPEVEQIALSQDLSTFYRRIRLKEFFLDATPSDPEPFYKKSTWISPKNRVPSLETYIQAVSSQLNDNKNMYKRKKSPPTSALG